jgi:citrate lyase beta subunit
VITTSTPPSPRRSLLFIPGDAQRKIDKAPTIDADALIFDLEDGVALNRKQAALETVAHALATTRFGTRERIVRVNAPESGLVEAEVRATCTADFAPDAYLAPKAESPAPLLFLDGLLSQLEAAQGRPAGAIRLMAMIETALGVLNLREIASATPRLDALILGAEDLAATTGARRTRDGWELLYARSALVIAAGAYGLDAIDCVHVDYQDADGLRAECSRARDLGMRGKTLIHPAQVPVANELFAPSADEVAWALRLIDAFEQHQAQGTGAFAFEGRMVDMPILRAARTILARATQG